MCRTRFHGRVLPASSSSWGLQAFLNLHLIRYPTLPSVITWPALRVCPVKFPSPNTVTSEVLELRTSTCALEGWGGDMIQPLADGEDPAWPRLLSQARVLDGLVSGRPHQKGQPSCPREDARHCPKHEESLTHKAWQPFSKYPGCLHIPVMKENPRSKNPEQLFTLAFLSCRRSWLGNHESSEIFCGMSKNKRNKSRLTHSLSPPQGAADWECLPS